MSDFFPLTIVRNKTEFVNQNQLYVGDQRSPAHTKIFKMLEVFETLAFIACVYVCAQNLVYLV